MTRLIVYSCLTLIFGIIIGFVGSEFLNRESLEAGPAYVTDNILSLSVGREDLKWIFERFINEGKLDSQPIFYKYGDHTKIILAVDKWNERFKDTETIRNLKTEIRTLPEIDYVSDISWPQNIPVNSNGTLWIAVKLKQGFRPQKEIEKHIFKKVVKILPNFPRSRLSIDFLKEIITDTTGGGKFVYESVE